MLDESFRRVPVLFYINPVGAGCKVFPQPFQPLNKQAITFGGITTAADINRVPDGILPALGDGIHMIKLRSFCLAN